MAMVGSFAIGTSSVITKMGLTASADGTASTDNMAFLRNSMWWAGMGALVVGEVAKFGAYTFAPPVMVTPLGALSVIVAYAPHNILTIFALFLLNERLGHLGRVGCGLCILGSSIIVLHAPEDHDLETVTQFLEYAVEPGLLLYCLTVCVFLLIMAYGVAPRHGRTNPARLHLHRVVRRRRLRHVRQGLHRHAQARLCRGEPIVYPSTYLFLGIAAVCIMVQLNYANKALDLFSVNLVNPIYTMWTK
ncbi:magnesium transporter [Mycena vulgaris]|nr:magnesium transporter [Mycena vulgaris]